MRDEKEPGEVWGRHFSKRQHVCKGLELTEGVVLLGDHQWLGVSIAWYG